MRGPSHTMTRTMTPEEREKWFRAHGAYNKSHSDPERAYLGGRFRCSGFTVKAGKRAPKAEQRTEWYHTGTLRAYNEWGI
jgi:hypothetical protein